jgi:hypothetical protein
VREAVDSEPVLGKKHSSGDSSDEDFWAGRGGFGQEARPPLWMRWASGRVGPSWKDCWHARAAWMPMRQTMRGCWWADMLYAGW